MCRDVPSMGVYMLSYEHVCSMLKKLSYDKRPIEMKKDSMPKYIQIISGGIAGNDHDISIIDSPYSILKHKSITIFQIKYTSM